jgi:hypothetical protein
MARKDRPLWRCEACGRSFANVNQSHACGRHMLETHFQGRSPKVRAIFDAFRAMLEGFGPVIVLPEKTRIAFQVRMSFAQLTVRRDWVLGHLVLARRAESAFFTRIETISPRNQVHVFRLDHVSEVAALRDHAREAYAVGRQDHLA